MTSNGALWQRFDAIGFDLDGVIYRGPQAVLGAPEVIRQLQSAGARVGFVTNNAYRPPEAVAAQLRTFGIACSVADVVTSAQATARAMAETLPPGAETLIVGSPALASEIAAVGLTPVQRRSASTRAVVVGYDPDLTWDALNEACYAIEGGASYFACNNDLTRPTEHGVAIGMGGMLAAIAFPIGGVAPVMGGKPARPLLDETRRRLVASDPLFVGDRLDTDIEGARAAGWASLFVLSGGHGPSDLLVAPPHQRPDYLAADVAGLLQPPRVVVADGDARWCGQATASAAFDLIVTLDGPLATEDQRLDALWAVANVAWLWADRGATVDATEALSRIGEFGPFVGKVS